MKIIAFIGSARKKHTYYAVNQFLTNLKLISKVDYELILLSELNLNQCRGCMKCFDKGEEFCPLKDDRDLIIGKIKESDGIVIGTPNYAFQVSGSIKVLFDRLSFFFHRPPFFGKYFTNIVVQGIYGGGKVVKYLNFIGAALGFNEIKGICLNTREPMNQKTILLNNEKISRLSNKFAFKLASHRYPKPSVIQLITFRIFRSKIKKMLQQKDKDYSYFKENGWFESDYFYPSKLNPIKKIIGKIVDKMV